MAFNVFNSSRFPNTFGGTFQLPTDEEQPSWMNFSKARNVPSVPNMSSVTSQEKQSFDPSSLPSKYGKLDFSATPNKFEPSDYGTSFDRKYMEQAITEKTKKKQVANNSKRGGNSMASDFRGNAFTPTWMKVGIDASSDLWNQNVSKNTQDAIGEAVKPVTKPFEPIASSTKQVKSAVQSGANPIKRLYEGKSISDPIKAFYESPEISDSEKSQLSDAIKGGMKRSQVEKFLTEAYSGKDVINEAVNPGFGEKLFTSYAKPLVQAGVGAANVLTNEKVLDKGSQGADFNDFWKLGSGAGMSAFNIAAPISSGAFNVFGSTSAGEATLSTLPGQIGVGAAAGYATGGLKGALIGAGVGAIPEGVKMVTENTPYLSDAVNSLTPSGQEAFYNFMGMAGMASAAHYAGKMNGMSDAQMIGNLESMGFKRDMATSITDNVKKANDFRIGKSIMDSRMGEYAMDVLTGMDASKRAGYKSNAYQAEEVKKMTERMESPEGIANVRDYQTEQHQRIGEEYVAKMERAQKFLSEDGNAYSQLKNSGQKVPANGIVTEFVRVLEKNGLGIDAEGNVYRKDTTKAGAINQTDVSNIDQLFKDIMGDVKKNGTAKDSNGNDYMYLDATQTLNARSTASKRAKYDAATTADGTKVIRELRGTIDRNAKQHLVGLKELDKNYADRLNAMNDALLDLVYRQGGQKGDWKSNFFNIISTLDRANRAKLSARMEEILPGITKRVQAINNLREIHTALTNTKLLGRAPLFTGIAMGYAAGGKMFPVVGHLFGAGAGAVLGLLGERMITNLRAKAIESIVGKMSDKARKEIDEISKKRMKNIRLSDKEREVVQKAKDAIEKEAQRIKAEENIRRIKEKHAKDKEAQARDIMGKMFPKEAPMLEAPKYPAGTSAPLPRNAPEVMASEKNTGYLNKPVSDITPVGKLETAKIENGKVVYPEQAYNKPKTPIIDLEGLKPEPPKGLPPEGEGGITAPAPKTPIIDLEGLKPTPPTEKPVAENAKTKKSSDTEKKPVSKEPETKEAKKERSLNEVMKIYEARSGKPLPNEMEASLRKAMDEMEKEFGKLGEVVFSADFAQNATRNPEKKYRLLVQKTGEKVLGANSLPKTTVKNGETVLKSKKPGKEVERYQGGFQAPYNDLIAIAMENAIKQGVIFHEIFHGVDTKTGLTNFSNDPKFVDTLNGFRESMKKDYNMQPSSKAYFESDHEVVARMVQQYMLQKLNPEHVMPKQHQGHWDPKYVMENAPKIKDFLKDIVEKAKDAKVKNFAIALIVGMGLADMFGSGDGGQEA